MNSKIVWFEFNDLKFVYEPSFKWKKFWNINWKCVSFGGITLNKGKKKKFEESEKATVRPELKQKTEWPRQESETQGFNYKNSNQLSKITKDHTKYAYK